MLEQLIAILKQSGTDKVKFKDSVRFKPEAQQHPIYITGLQKVRDTYMVSIEYLNDKAIRPLSSMDEKVLPSIKQRLINEGYAS